MEIRRTPKQKIAMNHLQTLQYEDVLFDGGARAGKTFCILMFFIGLCLRFEGIRLLIARLNFNHLKSAVWLQDLPKILPHFEGLYDLNHSDHIISFPLKKSSIWLGGLDTSERVEKVFGQEYAAIFLNEAVQLSPSTVDKVETRLAQKIDGFPNMMLYDCNPRHPEHFLYQRFYINKLKTDYQLSWTPYDNIENLGKKYIDRLERKKDEVYKQRFIKGLWVSLPGAVYRNVDADNIIDCNKEFNKYDDITVGIDFGLYSCFSVWGFKDNEAYCLYEAIIINGTTKDIIKKLDEIWGLKQKLVPLYCDHEPDRIQEICDAGYNAKPAYKEISAGDATVNEYILFFDTKCCNTFQSMLNLVHQQDKNDVYIEKHVKENDHEADGSRYGIMGYKMDNTRLDYDPFIDGLI